MDKRFLGILSVIVVALVVIVGISQHHSGTNTPASSTSQPTKHVEGQGQAGVTLVEWGDYECPVCADYYQAVSQVFSQFSKQIYFQFSNLPLTQIHPNAFAAARAAEAAGAQGKYFQMHNQLYTHQDSWVSASDPKSFYESYAKTIGLNVAQFDSDYTSDKVNSAINADLAAFTKTGQQMATPTFFLDGKYVSNESVVDPTTGQPSVAKFSSLINAEIAKVQAAKH